MDSNQEDQIFTEEDLEQQMKEFFESEEFQRMKAGVESSADVHVYGKASKTKHRSKSKNRTKNKLEKQSRKANVISKRKRKLNRKRK